MNFSKPFTEEILWSFGSDKQPVEPIILKL